MTWLSRFVCSVCSVSLLSLHEASLELSVCCVSAVSKDDAGVSDDRKATGRLSEAAARSPRLFVIMHPRI